MPDKTPILNYINGAWHAASGDRGRPQSASALIPMKRPGRADEVAAAIVWLLSAEASYTTGATLDVSGGR